MKRKIVAGNWKMNLSNDEATALFSQILQEKDTIGENTEVILFPPVIYGRNFVSQSKDLKNISIGSQNIHFEEQGAYTGEISAEMVKSCGLKFTLIGHSERRQYFGETDEQVNRKVHLALRTGLNVVLCVGEPLEIREKEEHVPFVASQLEKALKDVSAEKLKRIIIAYEPVWAIGTGLTASPEQAENMHAAIREWMKTHFGVEGENVPLLYGGSCNEKNAHDLFSCSNVDGGLIGGASLKATSFLSIVEAAG